MRWLPKCKVVVVQQLPILNPHHELLHHDLVQRLPNPT